MRSRRTAGQGLGFLADDAAERAVYVISVAAELAGMHPQTLRQYDRLGLVIPARTNGRGKRYCLLCRGFECELTIDPTRDYQPIDPKKKPEPPKRRFRPYQCPETSQLSG